MHSRYLVLASALVLSACSGELMQKSSEYGIMHEVITTKFGSFRVYEHPDGKRLAVSSTLAGAAGQGIVKGLTFGAGSVRPSEGAFREAAEAYIAKYPTLKSCKIVNGYLLQDPVFEFVMDCGK